MPSEEQLDQMTAPVKDVSAPTSEAHAEPIAPPGPYLRWIGHPGVYIPGVPQGNLEVVDEPAQVYQVSAARAHQLVKSGLYEPSKKKLDVGPRVVAEEEEVSANG